MLCRMVPCVLLPMPQLVILLPVSSSGPMEQYSVVVTTATPMWPHIWPDLVAILSTPQAMSQSAILFHLEMYLGRILLVT